MLFDSTHLLYIVISLATTALLLWAMSKIKSQKWKDRNLCLWGVLTFLLHVSYLWFDFMPDKYATVPDNIILPIYFCNLSMYLLLFVSLIRIKDTAFFHYVATFTAYAGFFGAMISLFYPDYYLANPDIWQWGVLKSLLSHSTMLVGSCYLFVGGYVKIRLNNMIPFCMGMVGVLLIGVGVNALYAALGHASPNAMYLTASAISDVPIFTGYTIGALMILVALIFTFIYELLAVPRELRWRMT